MIKVVCIQIPENYKLKFQLEIGKIYEAKQIPYYWLINNTVFSYDPAINLNSFYIPISFYKKYFITLAEWRQQQIDKILNND